MLGVLQWVAPVSRSHRPAPIDFPACLLASPPPAHPQGAGLSEVAYGGGRAVRAARDLVPHLPQLLPGLHKTMELFVRQLGARWAIRFAESLAPGQQYGGQPAGQYGGPQYGGQQYGGQPGQYGGQPLPQPYYGQQSFYGQSYPQQQQQQQQQQHHHHHHQPYWGQQQQQQQGGYRPLPPQQQQFGGSNHGFGHGSGALPEGASGLEGAWGQQKPAPKRKK
jgi:hypothetical protein